jgi:hypothetical protein
MFTRISQLSSFDVRLGQNGPTLDDRVREPKPYSFLQVRLEYVYAGS